MHIPKDELLTIWLQPIVNGEADGEGFSINNSVLLHCQQGDKIGWRESGIGYCHGYVIDKSWEDITELPNGLPQTILTIRCERKSN
jgi:hypothetical protein